MAIGTLKGAVHGGANEEAMRMFFEIEDASNVDKWFEENIKTGKKRVMAANVDLTHVLSVRAVSDSRHVLRLNCS
jgi:hypothetical protein